MLFSSTIMLMMVMLMPLTISGLLEILYNQSFNPYEKFTLACAIMMQIYIVIFIAVLYFLAIRHTGHADHPVLTARFQSHASQAEKLAR